VGVDVTEDTVGFEIEHGVVRAGLGAAEGLAGCFTAFAGAFVPGRGADCEALGGRDDAVEGVEFWAVDDGGLVSYQNSLDVVEGVEDYGASVAKADLKDRVVVLFPPVFAYRGVVFAEVQEVAEERDGSWDFWDASDVGYIGPGRVLTVPLAVTLDSSKPSGNLASIYSSNRFASSQDTRLTAWTRYARLFDQIDSKISAPIPIALYRVLGIPRPEDEAFDISLDEKYVPIVLVLAGIGLISRQAPPGRRGKECRAWRSKQN